MNIKTALSFAKESLQVCCENPLFEAEILLTHHLQVERSYLHIHDTKEVENFQDYKALVARRVADEPFEYIVGKANFYDVTLLVNETVLIPRPETELLVDKVAKLIETHNIEQLVEVGVGSGAISIVLARKFPKLQIVAVDISKPALDVAQQNIEKYGLTSQITLKEGNLLSGLESVPLVVSNPPYIANNAVLKANVKAYEPHSALYGGEMGDELLKRLISQAKERDVQFLCCEMGYDQKESLQAYMKEIGVKYMQFYKDYAGLDRGFELAFKE